MYKYFESLTAFTLQVSSAQALREALPSLEKRKA